jgi:hypothetical protein
LRQNGNRLHILQTKAGVLSPSAKVPILLGFPRSPTTCGVHRPTAGVEPRRPQYVLVVAADVNHTFVQALAPIGLSVGRDFEWPSFGESTLAGFRVAAPMVIDEGWATMSETVNGWRGSMATGRCSHDWSLNVANTRTRSAPSSLSRWCTSPLEWTPTTNR